MANWYEQTPHFSKYIYEKRNTVVSCKIFKRHFIINFDFEIHFSWDLFQILFRYLVATATGDWIECYFPLCDFACLDLAQTQFELWILNIFFNWYSQLKNFFWGVSYIQKIRKCCDICFASKILNTFNFFLYIQTYAILKLKRSYIQYQLSLLMLVMY